MDEYYGNKEYINMKISIYKQKLFPKDSESDSFVVWSSCRCKLIWHKPKSVT